MENVNSDLIRGNIDTIILKCLNAGDMYGLEICNHIKKASNGTYILKQPTLYSALKRLEGKGFITSYWRDSAIGGRRHYYKLTEDGKQSFPSRKDQWFVSKEVIDTLVDAKPQINQQPAAILPANDETAATPAISQNTVTTDMAISPYTPFAETDDDDFITLPFRISGNEESALQQKSTELQPLTNLPHSQKAEKQQEVPPLLRYVFADETPSAPSAQEKNNTFSRYLSPDDYAAITTVKTGAAAKTAKIANYDIQIRPFVKHYADKKRGDFHYIAKLRLVSAFLMTLVLITGILIARNNLKPNNYTQNENLFFSLGYALAGIYFVYYVVRFFANPQSKKALQNQMTEHFIRLGICLGTIIAILAINTIAGLTHVNSPDFLVFWVIPCILAAAIYIEGIIQFLLRKTNLFVA